MAYPDPVQAAIDAGLSVVPADKDKRPAVKWRAWVDQVQTDDDRKYVGHGSLWAVVTGQLYGFVVLDFDGPDGLETMQRLGLEPHVRSAAGAHVYVTHPGHPVKSSAKKFEQYPGLDIKGDKSLAYFHGRSKKGSYEPLVWPPAPITLPEELAEELFPHPQETSEYAGTGRTLEEYTYSAEAERYLERLCSDIRNAEPGTSNAELNKAGFAVGGLIAGGQLEEEPAYEALLEAAEDRNCGDADVVLRSALQTGMEKPWVFTPEEDEWIPSIALTLFATKGLPDEVPFPVDALPSPLDTLVRDGARQLSCPEDYLGAGLLSTLGTAIGGYVDLEVLPNWKESANVFIGLVGPPGAVKSPAMGLLMSPILDAEERYEDAALVEAQALKDDGREFIEVSAPRLVVDDATIEALFGVMQNNPRGLILAADELTGWLKGMGQYKGGLGRDRQHWLSIWSRKSIKVDRVKGATRSIRRPFVSVLGGIQPEPLEELLSQVDDGLVPRFLMARGEPTVRVLRRGVLDGGLVRQYHGIWNRLRDNGTVERTNHFTDAGYAAYETWVNATYAQAPKVPSELAGTWAKLDGQLARVCLILAEVFETAVTPDVVDRGIALMTYFQGQAASLLRASSSGTAWEKQNARRTKDLARIISENPGISRIELMAKAPAWALTSRTLDQALEPLREAGIWKDPA